MRKATRSNLEDSSTIQMEVGAEKETYQLAIVVDYTPVELGFSLRY
jgi:hypothetical protein